jgi:hypothetical protein
MTLVGMETACVDQAENIEQTLQDARSVNSSISALHELLQGCSPGYKITAANMLTFIESMAPHLENVIDGLQVLQANARLAPRLHRSA